MKFFFILHNILKRDLCYHVDEVVSFLGCVIPNPFVEGEFALSLLHAVYRVTVQYIIQTYLPTVTPLGIISQKCHCRYSVYNVLYRARQKVVSRLSEIAS